MGDEEAHCGAGDFFFPTSDLLEIPWSFVSLLLKEAKEIFSTF